MQTIKVELGQRAYPILIGSGLLDRTELWDGDALGHDALIVSDTNVAPLYLDRLRTALGQRRIAQHIVAAGEPSKKIDEVARVIDALVAHGARRDTSVIALGGGVIGDLSGFAAACFMRGVRFVQVPTSLLAQVDSSVGGKTGVNHPQGKNLIGAFHQPTQVVIDTDTLTTLSDRELKAGIAEVIKSALLADDEFFGWLESNMDKLLARDAAALAHAIARCCQIKAGVVARDEKEAGERMLLNLGHTFGHAIETVGGYKDWLHGEAVGAGLVMAARLSEQRDLLSAADVRRVAALVAAAGLPTHARPYAAQALYDAMSHDKKFSHGRNRFILLTGIGQALIVQDVPAEQLHRCLREFAA